VQAEARCLGEASVSASVGIFSHLAATRPPFCGINKTVAFAAGILDNVIAYT
jgi:hypothetical protein